MPLSPNQFLDHYVLTEIIGEGGMGTVWRARDTTLDRDVAIKVLPPEFSADPERLARFEREAKAVAALSHPNIVAIHGFGTHEGNAYAAIELLEGSALDQHLEEGPLPPRKALEIARQVATGLAAAHAKGIVHRDLKPANVFLSPDGRARILDFGLAAVVDVGGHEGTHLATHTSLTNPGAVMGTTNYMSPEQVQGAPADSRTDIFALGSVLYEMLTGRKPFERETAPETMTAILREDPPEIDRDGVSPSVARIVQRCLEKVPEQRFQSAHDLAFALEGASQTSGTAASAVITDGPPRAARRGWWVPALLALVAGVLIGGFGVSRLRPTTAAAPVKIRPITFSGLDGGPAISPDGRMIAFRSERGQTQGIWIKQLDRGDAVRLTSGSDSAARFSPDGTTLLFGRSSGRTADGIYKVSTVGGEPRKVIDNAVEGDWSPDGSRIVFIRSGSVLIAKADGTDEQVVADTRQGETRKSPRWSPDGRTIAFIKRPGVSQVPLDIMLLDVDSGALRALPPKRPSVSQLAWSGSGHELVYAWSEDLLAGAATSEASVVLHDIRSGEIRELFWARDMLDRFNGMELAVVAPGVVAFGTLSLRQSLSRIDLDRGDASSPTLLTSGNGVDRQPRLAPDGETILFSSNRTGNLDLWTVHRTSGTVRQLTDDSASDWDPAFVNDGREIVWSSDRSGNLEIWIANADGSGARQVTQDGVNAENPTATPDGEWIVYMTSNPAHPGLWKIRRDGSEATRLWEGAGFISELSPDGRHALFGTATNRVVHILVVDIATSELLPFRIGVPTDIQLDSLRGNFGRARWTDGGRSIAFLGAVDNELGVFTQAFAKSGDTSSTRRPLAGFDPVWVTESFEVSLDGSVVILSRKRPGGTVMLAENVPYVTPPRAP